MAGSHVNENALYGLAKRAKERTTEQCNAGLKNPVKIELLKGTGGI